MCESKTNINDTCILVLSYVNSALQVTKGHSIWSIAAIILIYSPTGGILKSTIDRLYCYEYQTFNHI